jgi:hypothetical protein
MDLLDLTPKEDTIEVVLKHPNTEEVLLNEDKSPMTIELHATHSKAYKAAVHIQTNKQLKKVKGKGNKDFALTAEDLEESSLDILVKATKSWNITYGGEKPKLTKAPEIYEKVFWIKDQIEEVLNSSLDFTKK